MKPTAVNGWLLDTHALLLMLYGDKRLSRRARAIINGGLPLCFSTVSFWEIAIKRSTKGFDFEIEDDWDIVLPRALRVGEVIRIDLEAADCRLMEQLPRHHRDPFDRMLVAQAAARRLGILSRDAQFDSYPILRAW